MAWVVFTFFAKLVNYDAYKFKGRNLIKFFKLLRFFVADSLLKKYSRFRLGVLWTIVEPLSMAVLLWLVFAVVLKDRGFGLDPYLLFLTVAILPWWWFSNTVSSATKIVKQNRAFFRSSVHPPWFWVLVAVSVSTFEFIMSIPILILVIVFTGFYPSLFIFSFFIAFLLQFILLLGLSFIIVSTSAVLPDVSKIVRIVSRALFYLSPIIYSFSDIPASFQSIASLNPLVGIISLYRLPFWPAEYTGFVPIIFSVFFCLFALVLGVFLFKKTLPRILKNV